MGLSDKLSELANICGPTIKPLAVKRRWHLLGLIPFLTFDSFLWVADEGEWWRVMLSRRTDQWRKHYPIIGADFRKGDGNPRESGGFISWKWDAKEWELTRQPEAEAIRERIERAIDLAHRQFSRPPTD